jgi:hypothetical protein
LSESINEPLVCQLGDEVKIRMSFTHSEHITAVEVVYASVEDRSYTFCLNGNPILDEGSSTVGKDKGSTVELSAVWDGAYTPGHYHMDRVVFYTFSGVAMHDVPVAVLGDEEWPVLVLDTNRYPVQISKVTLISEDTDEPEE